MQHVRATKRLGHRTRNLFYVMEYLEGLDLQNLVLRFGPMPSARVLHYLRQLCGSLADALAARLVHRDSKRANLFAWRVGGVWPASARSLLGLLERSKLIGACTVADAENWWNAHAGELEEVCAPREPSSPAPEYTRIPRSRAGDRESLVRSRQIASFRA